MSSSRNRGSWAASVRAAVATVIAFAVAVSGSALAANAAIVAKHEITANWAAPAPTSVQYGNAIIGEWHISTNDADQPESNGDVANVTATLVATNGRFASVPTVCQTSGVTPASSISADGTTLVCNLGTVEAGTATVLQASIRATSSTGGSLSASGTVTSDTAEAVAGPANLSPVRITYNYGMDLVIATPSSAPVEGGQRSQFMSGTQRRERMIVDWAIAANAGSRPGPVNYSFIVNITSSTAGAVLTGIRHENCSSIDSEVTGGMPFSAPTRPDRASFPGCTITRLSATRYRVNLTNIDYSLTHVPVNDSKGNPLPQGKSYIAAGALTFSNPHPVNVTTNFRYTITAPAWSYPGTNVTTADPTANNVDTVTLYRPGLFANRWAGTPTGGRSPWDDQLFVSAGVGKDWTLPSPTGAAAGQPLPLYMQAGSLAWNTYTGTGGTNLAGVCTMNQTATSRPGPESNNFVLKYMDGGGYDGAQGGYQQMRTAQFWYTTANIDTKTFTCDNGSWTRMIPAAGTRFQDPRVTGSNVMQLPPNVTAIKITWNPRIDKPHNVLIRGFGYIKENAAPSTTITGEGWTVGSYNHPNGTWYNYSNGSTTRTATPWSDYAVGTNGWRDPFRIVGNTGRISKSASPLEAGPGVPVTYTVKAQTVSTTQPPIGSNITVVDTLPLGMGYLGGTARIDGVTVTPTITPATPTVGQRLTFTMPNSPANVDRVITYQAQLPTDSTVKPGSTLTNSAVISVPGDTREASRRTARASVVVPNDGTTSFGKSGADTFVPYAGGSSSWKLTINSLDPVVNPYTDTIDILPYAGDENGTNIDGGYTVDSVTVPGSAWKVYVTTEPPGSLTDDPRHASNGTAPGAVTGNTVGWTAVTVSGTTAAVPAGATALRVIGPALTPGAQQSFDINFTTAAPTGESCAAPADTDNKPGQVIVNAATSYAGHTRLPMLSSATTTIADCNEIQIKKYVLAKGADPAVAANWHDAQDPSDYAQYGLGDQVPYRLTVTNQGTGTLTDVAVTDPMFPQCDFTVASLAAGASQSRDCTAGPAELGTTVNTAFVDVQPPVGAALSGSDPAGIVVPLPPEVTKTAEPASGSIVEPGDTVTYTITISEPDDSPAPFPAPSLADALAGVLDDATLVPGSIATSTSLSDGGDPGTATITGTTLNWSSSRIWPGETITISYAVTVDDPTTGDHRLENVVTPKTGIDCVTCATEHPIPGIHVTKSADVAVTHPGDIVTYTVTVENTGEVDFTLPGYPAQASDPLTDVLTEADYVSGSATNGAVFDGDSIDWSGALAIGATTSFSFQVQIKDPNPGDDRLVNTVTSTTPGSNCADGSTDPDCDATVLVQSYTVEKTTPEEPVVRGDVVFYTITLTNTGAVPYTGVGADVASYEDDLSDVLDDASYNGDVTGGAVFSAGHLTWSGALPVGASKTFTYSVTVRQDPEPTSLVLNNVVAPTGPGGSCAADDACDTSTPIAQFHVVKTSSPAYENPGGTVHYVITVTNTGQVDFTDGFPASFRDSFSGIVDDGELDAVLDDDGTIVSGSVTATAGTVTYQGSTLSWSGPLALADTVTIEYDVLVDQPDRGDHLLANRITTPEGLANCDTDSTDPDCETETPIQSYRLVKEASQTTAQVGDTITYTITVTNTGNVDYPAGAGEPQAQISDPIGDVLASASFDGTVTASSGTATYDAGTQTIGWVGDLPVGGSPVVITYDVEITATVEYPDKLTNRASTDSPGGNCEPGVDIDLADPACHVSVPTRSYEADKSVSQTVVEPGTDDLTYTITVRNTGGVDYTGTTIGDPEAAEILDSLADILADASNPVLISQPSDWQVAFDDDPLSATYGRFQAAGPLGVGESVTFAYTVDIDDPDTGDHRLENRVSTPPGRGGNCTELSTDPGCDATVLVREFTVEKSVTPSVTQIGDTVVYTIVVKNTGQVAYDGLTPDTSAGFADDLSDVLDDASFGSVVRGPATFDGVQTVSWSGALPIGGTVTVTYTVTATGADEHVLINGVRPDGPGGDCADAPAVCETEVRIRSYEYEKTATPASVTEGDTVTYTVTVRNTGAVAYTDADPAGFTDDLSGVFDDAGDLGDLTVTPDVGAATARSGSLAWSGPLALPGQAGDTVTVSYTVTVDDPDTGDHHLVNEITGIPGTGGSCTEPGDCETDTPVRSYVVEKTSAPATTVAGGIVEYAITVTNTGAVAFTDDDPASLRDDLSDVLDVAGAPTDLAVAGDSDDVPTFDATAEELRWSGELPIDGVVTLSYRVQVMKPVPADADFLLENVVEPTAPGGECVPSGCDTVTPIRAYSTIKQAGSTEVEPGDTVVYTVTVTNIGQVAYTAETPATFTDDLSDVLDDATGPNDLSGGATFDAGTVSWSGPLPIGAVVIVTYSVVVEDPDETGGDAILENAVLTGPEGTCEDPTAEDCTTITEVRSLHYAKTVSHEVAHPGDVVEYEVTVRNTGSVDFTADAPAEFDDSLAQLLDDVEDVSESSLALVASSGTAGYDATLKSIHWEGPLVAGGSATVRYQVTILDPNLGDNRLANRVVTPPGVPTNCEEGSDDPDCGTVTEVKSFHIRKSADRTEFHAGDIVTYTITLRNTGAVAYTAEEPVTWSDPLAQVTDEADYRGDISGGATYDAGTNTLNWSGPLDVGETLTFTYSVRVMSPIPDDKMLYNRVGNPPGIGGNCAPGSGDPVCEVTLGGPSVRIVKTSSETEAFPGDVVAYSVTITNDGGVDWTTDRPAILDDSLSDVLDDAEFNDDATNGAMLDGSTLRWFGPLAVGDSVTIEYSVTIRAPASGDGLMDNVVTTPPEVPSNCVEIEDDGAGDAGGEVSAAAHPTDSTDPDCTTRTLVKSYSTIKSSSAAGEVAPGDRITYTITVVNTGQLEYTEEEPAFFEDDLSGVLDDARYLGDATGDTSYDAPVLRWEGPLAIGERITVSYSIVVSPTGGDDRLLNAVFTPFEIGGSCFDADLTDCELETLVDRPLAATGSPLFVPLAGILVLLGVGGALLLLDRRRRSRGEPVTR